jgi:hypothetical protein
MSENVVYAVSNCHPTRIAVYAAAFQGHWSVEFKPSLEHVMEAVRIRRPRAVFYDHTNRGREWDQYCSEISRMGIPFILLAHKPHDETFMVLLSRGGYHAWGTPLASEQILKAVALAEEIGRTHAAAPGVTT